MEKTKIEWCDSSWNPISGCYHDCEYCYARKIANRYKGCCESPDGVSPGHIAVVTERLKATTKNGEERNAAYPFGFTPTFHQYRLTDPFTKGFGKNVFVCSMADMFGDWVPDEWITQIFEACKKADNHRYLFLTKNPKRYSDLATKGLLPNGDGFWYGSSVTTPTTTAFWSEEYNTFASIEPILEPFVYDDGCEDFANRIGWVILGAETGNRKDKVVPERSWMEPIVEQFHKFGKPVFMKESLIPIWGEDLITEFPWKE